MSRSRLRAAAVAATLALGASWTLVADEPASPPKKERRFRLGVELKGNLRHSTFEQTRPGFPFPPDFIPPGETAVFQRTVQTGTSAELSNVALIGEADLTPDISARIRIHFLDLYNRNPTSSEDRVFVREAWIRFGQAHDGLEAIPGTSLFALVGKAPRFSKQIERRLESYGLWGTAVGRFEEVGLQLGGSFGKHVTWRGLVGSPNPLFFRDPNALAGDNGTPERQPGNVHPIFQSGFPILYDAKSSDVTFNGRLQYGGGLGFRLVSADGEKAVDVLAWAFSRSLNDSIALRGTSYSGDLKLLQAFAALGIAFDVDGRRKLEAGVNVEARFHDLHLFGQLIHQDIAGLTRSGYEVEVAYYVPLNGLFLSGETPILNWVEPCVRVSEIVNHFFTPRTYPAPSIGWDWVKYDIGVRIGILTGVDLTVEYSRNDVLLFSGAKIHPDETLVTLRAGF